MTILLAWINAKYNTEYETLFIATILLDILGMTMLMRIFG